MFMLLHYEFNVPVNRVLVQLNTCFLILLQTSKIKHMHLLNTGHYAPPVTVLLILFMQFSASEFYISNLNSINKQ